MRGRAPQPRRGDADEAERPQLETGDGGTGGVRHARAGGRGRMKFKLNNSRDPSKYRLPLIALIDVVLFLLLYFMVAGTLAPEEAELSAALRSEKGAGGKALDLQPQVIAVQ